MCACYCIICVPIIVLYDNHLIICVPVIVLYDNHMIIGVPINVLYDNHMRVMPLILQRLSVSNTC